MKKTPDIVVFILLHYSILSAQTNIHDFADTLKFEINTIEFSFSSGKVGSATMSDSTGNCIPGTDFTNISVVDIGKASGNLVGWTNYGYVKIKFSQPLVVGDGFGILDADGEIDQVEQFAIVGRNSFLSTTYYPRYTNIGADLLLVRSAAKKVISDVFLKNTIIPTLRTRNGQINTPVDHSGQAQADFGENMVDEVYILYGIASNNTTINTESEAGFSDPGMEFLAGMATLPLDLISFEAKEVNTSVNIGWNVQHVEGMSHFDVQRSRDGIDFKTIARVESVGSENEYVYIDWAPFGGKNFYRLGYIHIDGRVEYSPIRQVSVDMGNQIWIYPNPVFSGDIQITDNMAHCTFLFDKYGHLIREIQNGSRCNVDDLAPGIYHVVTDRGDRSTFVRY